MYLELDNKEVEITAGVLGALSLMVLIGLPCYGQSAQHLLPSLMNNSEKLLATP